VAVYSFCVQESRRKIPWVLGFKFWYNPSMKFKINPKIFEEFDQPVIGVIIAIGIDNKNDNLQIQKLLREAEVNLRKDLNGVEISGHSHIAPWREIYKKFGSKPRDFRCSAEALTRIILRGSEIKKISPLVDLYNLISIKYILPVGAEDLDKMEGDLELTFADGTEDYTPLGEEEYDPPKMGEVIYRDDFGVICRRWNWREGDRTKITKSTKNAVVVIESIASIPIKDAVEELGDLIKQYCGGEIKIYYLNKDTQDIDLKSV
jgi:DNA/RNA-binding domain of Phe-tRNA-synthetase-like protein